MGSANLLLWASLSIVTLACAGVMLYDYIQVYDEALKAGKPREKTWYRIAIGLGPTLLVFGALNGLVMTRVVRDWWRPSTQRIERLSALEQKLRWKNRSSEDTTFSFSPRSNAVFGMYEEIKAKVHSDARLEILNRHIRSIKCITKFEVNMILTLFLDDNALTAFEKMEPHMIEDSDGVVSGEDTQAETTSAARTTQGSSRFTGFSDDDWSTGS